MHVSTAFLALCLTAVPGLALAQQPPAAKPAPDTATLKVARETVAQMQGDRTATLSSMTAPRVGLVQQMGVKQPDQAQVMVQEVVMPTLSAHYDELLDIQARGYAAALGKDDLQAISTFYASPAGKRLVAAQPQLAQAQLTGMQQWMQSVMPEMQSKLTKAIQEHGWAANGQNKPR